MLTRGSKHGDQKPDTFLWLNPPPDRPFETIQNVHFQKCLLVLYTHGDAI